MNSIEKIEKLAKNYKKYEINFEGCLFVIDEKYEIYETSSISFYISW